MARILIVDDEPRIRKIVSLLLREAGHEIREAASAEGAIEAHEGFSPAVVLLDLNLPEMSGLEAIPLLLEKDPEPSIIIMTAYGTIRSAVDAMRAGAFDYVTKPFDNDELLLVIERALEVQRLNAEVESLRSELESRYGFSEIIGICPGMQEVFRIMSRVKDLDATVLVTGESGTGKELISRAIHRHSKRSAGPFVAVNCSAIPETLIEAEFFGHEKGAFTDAQQPRAGKFEQADRGTLFLDEIGDLPLDAQAKLLRVLQDRIVTRLGGKDPKKVDVRVISATNKNLQEMVREGTFRKDLYWRIIVVEIKLPPLRERREDLPLLIDFLIQGFNQRLGLKLSNVSPGCRDLLVAYEWPGNIRELENVLCQAMILCESDRLSPTDLPPRVRGEEFVEESSSLDLDSSTLTDAVQAMIDRLEGRLIRQRLRKCNGNRQSTAESLGISRKTLFNKMKHLGIEFDDLPEPEH